MNEQGEIFLVPFPFSDMSGNKVRPVLVISNNKYNATGEDIIVCGITKRIKYSVYSIEINSSDLGSGTLYSKSTIKVENLLKIKRNLIIKKIGELKPEILEKVIKIVIGIFKSQGKNSDAVS